MALDAGFDVIYHCDFADDAAIDAIAAAEDRRAAALGAAGAVVARGADTARARRRVFLGPAVGYLQRGGHNYEQMIPDRKVPTTSRVYQQLRERAPRLRVVVGGDYGFPPTPQAGCRRALGAVERAGAPHGHRLRRKGDNAFDLECFVNLFGYTPAEALRSATQYGGELMGFKAS